MLTLLHTADWQIGRIFNQVDDDDASALFEARLDVVRRLASIATRECVDAVLVAGDVFDAQTVSDKTIRRLFDALDAYDGPWLLLPGNHDAALGTSVWQRAIKLDVVRPNIRLCLTPESFVVEDRFQLLPAPLTQRHTHLDLTQWFDLAPPVGDLPRIGLAHGCVQGLLADGIDSANPIAADRAATARLDYLALGDWHGTRRVDARTWYAGTPETDRFRANDSGQALLVRIGERPLEPSVQAIATGRFRWRSWEPALQVATDLEALLESLAGITEVDVVQLRPTGACDLAAHQRLHQAIDAARARARALIADLSALRVEPTADDIASLHADGYVGAVVESLRALQSDPQRASTANDALLVLAGLLDDMQGASPAKSGASR